MCTAYKASGSMAGASKSSYCWVLEPLRFCLELLQELWNIFDVWCNVDKHVSKLCPSSADSDDCDRDVISPNWKALRCTLTFSIARSTLSCVDFCRPLFEHDMTSKVPWPYYADDLSPLTMVVRDQ